MSREIALALIIPLCIVIGSLIVVTLLTKLQRWRKRRTMEQGITDLVRRVRS